MSNKDCDSPKNLSFVKYSQTCVLTSTKQPCKDNVPVRGSDIDLVVTWQTETDMTMDGTKWAAMLDGHTIHTFDTKQNVTLKKGDTVVTEFKQSIPSFTPPGSFTFESMPQDENNTSAGCEAFMMNLSLGSSDVDSNDNNDVDSNDDEHFKFCSSNCHKTHELDMPIWDARDH